MCSYLSHVHPLVTLVTLVTCAHVCVRVGNELLLKLPGNVQATLRVPDAQLNPLMSEMQTVRDTG